MPPTRWILPLFACVAGLTLVVAGGASCGSNEEISLSNEVPCNEHNPCPVGTTCLFDKCIAEGSILRGETCTEQAQCSGLLICRDFACNDGCADLYYLDHCTQQTWCKPVPGSELVINDVTLPAGECAPSECDPSDNSERCADGSACVAIAADVGACLPYCQYGVTGGAYFDTCTDDGRNDFACQPLGTNSIPVCLLAGDETGPTAGIPGCDAIRNPCQAGSVCFAVVCRKLCTASQINPCASGEICAPVGTRTDAAFCRAPPQ